ncbi:hypothetical protein LTR62_006468 [Meristemomyces frigidus]|uniref:DUF788 domain protein n=1 Tax=Meristemomyces frigidus TaxID=1508187 RepID=A0AAN7TE30_9PEZI|nr:hypothetical protein LTR62_006468 [Meristemomyces frigidus]
MAKKALKTQATTNTATLNRTHLISLGIYTFFALVKTILFSRRILPCILLSAPALAIEFWFERIGRPVYTQGANGAELSRAGEDLEAKGLTEWMWDVVYWTWGNVVLVAILGDWAWWLYLVVPGYSAYLAFSTYTGMRSGFSGFSAGAGGEGEGSGSGSAGSGPSKRQAKLEKRGGQRVQYRQ